MNDVENLIQKAEGGNFSPAKYSKCQFGLFGQRLIEPARWEYGLEEQLDAIRVLGYTKDERALQYLRNLYSCDQKARSEELGNTGTYNRWNVYEYHAKGPLQEALCFEIMTAWVISCSTSDYQDGEDEEDIEDDRKQHIARSEVHQTILKAIENLERDIEHSPVVP